MNKFNINDVENVVKLMSKEDLVYNLADIFMEFRKIDENDEMSFYGLKGALDYIFNERLRDVFKDF